LGEVGEPVDQQEATHTPFTSMRIDCAPTSPHGQRALRVGLTVREQWTNARPHGPQAATELDRIEELTVWLDEEYATKCGEHGIGPYIAIRAIREAIATNPQGFAHVPHAVPLVTHIAERWAEDNSWFSAKPPRRRRAAPPAAEDQSQGTQERVLPDAVRDLLPAVRQVCGFSSVDLVPEIETDVLDMATRLHTQRQATSSHVDLFAKWYARCYWRGKKDGAKPSLRDVSMLWDQAMAAIAAGALSPSSPTPPSGPRASKGRIPTQRRGPVSATEGVQLDEASIPHRAPRPRPAKEIES